jgi:protein-S-isoprenylcysteine O-methyltransferase Ste14
MVREKGVAMTPMPALVALWAVFVVSWIVAAVWARQTVRRSTSRFQAPLVVGVLVAGLLLALAVLWLPAMRQPVWQSSAGFGWAMFAVTVVGLAFCWWARLHLGALWSAGISRKEDHRIVDTGPYGIVRHPMYSGVFLGLFAMAAFRGRPLDFAIAVLLTLFFALKALVEEEFLRAELGADYNAYRARVPMLVPFLKLASSSRA